MQELLNPSSFSSNFSHTPCEIAPANNSFRESDLTHVAIYRGSSYSFVKNDLSTPSSSFKRCYQKVHSFIRKNFEKFFSYLSLACLFAAPIGIAYESLPFILMAVSASALAQLISLAPVSEALPSSEKVKNISELV